MCMKNAFYQTDRWEYVASAQIHSIPSILLHLYVLDSLNYNSSEIQNSI